MIVVDASVAVKLYRDERDSGSAAGLMASNAGQMLAPDLFAADVAGAIVRDANSDKGIAALQIEKLTHFSAFLDGRAIELVRMSPEDVRRSGELAILLGHPIKDCAYLTLAMERACPLITADLRFAEKTRGVYDEVRMLASE